jgi:hypothetical protein
LTDADVRTLQQQLADGGQRPKVALLRDSALGPAGTPGAVVTITEPAVGECVIVRVRGDDLPFAADELTWPVRKPRGRPRKEATETKAATPATPAATAAPAAVAAKPEAPAAAPPTPPPTPPPAPAPTPPPPTAPPAAAQMQEAPAPKKTAARRRTAAGAPPPFSVSLRFTGKGWTSESSRSGKRSKPQPVSLAAMRALAVRLDDVDLRNTIIASLDHCRREVEERAAALRAELEAAEIALAELEEDA